MTQYGMFRQSCPIIMQMNLFIDPPIDMSPSEGESRGGGSSIPLGRL